MLYKHAHKIRMSLCDFQNYVKRDHKKMQRKKIALLLYFALSEKVTSMQTSCAELRTANV